MDKARLFASLPYPLKKAAAAARGRYLESWRYDHLTEQRVAEALERESWSGERWRAWHEERLVRLLVHAAREVPYYREMWSARRHRGDRSAVEELANWPVLEKEPLRSRPRAFLADSKANERLFSESTSGSTGTPLSLFWDAEATRQWYALVEARCRRWHGLTRQDRWAILGGQPIVPAQRRRPPFWVWNAAMSQLYLSASHLAPDLIPAYLAAMREHGVGGGDGDSAARATLARPRARPAELGRARGQRHAEPLYAHQRERIAAAFGCPARETYGMAELVAAASECPAGRLHLWPEAGIAELDHGGEIAAAKPGANGELIATGLLNFAQPLIRYRLGDRLSLAPEPAAGEICACGRRLPELAAVDGRSDDVVITPDGRRLGRLDPIFKGGLPLLEAQVVQETAERLRLRYVPAPGFTSATENELRRRFAARIGPMELVFERVAQLERTRNGKLRGVVSHLGKAATADSTGFAAEESGLLLSVILPVRDEQAFIERSLASILGQSVGLEKMEILLVDGMSEDETRIRAASMLSAHQKIPWKILDNPGKTAPCAMNVGLRAARGAFFARVDGHSEIEEKYLEKAMDLLTSHPEAAGVGGRLETLGQGTKAAVIAAAMSSSFGVGGAAFRLPGPPGSVVAADTVAFPVYRRRAIEENGFFDETLVRNQDDEYNFRLRKRGWKILLAADLKVKYYSRSTFRKLFRQYYEYGIYKVRVLQKHPRQMSPRHFVPFLFVGALATSLALLPVSPFPALLLLGLWGLAALLASLQLAVREKWSLGDALPRVALLPWAFFLLHIGYGAGCAAGLLRFGGGFFSRETP